MGTVERLEALLALVREHKADITSFVAMRREFIEMRVPCDVLTELIAIADESPAITREPTYKETWDDFYELERRRKGENA